MEAVPYALSDDELTRDAILRGRLMLWQPRAGYRFSVDALLLADFAASQQFERAYDLCTGCGVVALALAVGRATGEVVGVELQPRLAAVARKNAVENHVVERVRIVELDLRDLDASRAQLPGASAELVTCNPPFRPEGQGSTNPDDEEAIARHELRLRIDEVVATAARLLRPGGRLLLVVSRRAVDRSSWRCSTTKSSVRRARAWSTDASTRPHDACWSKPKRARAVFSPSRRRSSCLTRKATTPPTRAASTARFRSTPRGVPPRPAGEALMIRHISAGGAGGCNRIRPATSDFPTDRDRSNTPSRGRKQRQLVHPFLLSVHCARGLFSSRAPCSGLRGRNRWAFRTTRIYRRSLELIHFVADLVAM